MRFERVQAIAGLAGAHSVITCDTHRSGAVILMLCVQNRKIPSEGAELVETIRDMFVSVVTPSFRQLEWLKLCAASVADQAGVKHEHIIQDAGSGPEIEEWARTIPGLTLYVEKDEGMYDAINRGLRRARGAVCSYLNSDEQLLPGALAIVVSFFDAHPNVDVLFGDAVLIDRSGTPISYRRTIPPTLSHVRYAHLNTPTCATFFRRRLLDRGFFFDSKWKMIGDQVWMEQLLLANVPMATLSRPLAVFTFTGENLGSTKASEEETLRRRGPGSLATGCRKTAAILSHRLRKLFAGAYRPRHADVQIYTLQSPSVRVRRSARVGFEWPKTS
jgi:glycosyltransferase involved in cell wall biosynthesis